MRRQMLPVNMRRSKAGGPPPCEQLETRMGAGASANCDLHREQWRAPPQARPPCDLERGAAAAAAPPGLEPAAALSRPSRRRLRRSPAPLRPPAHPACPLGYPPFAALTSYSDRGITRVAAGAPCDLKRGTAAGAGAAATLPGLKAAARRSAVPAAAVDRAARCRQSVAHVLSVVLHAALHARELLVREPAVGGRVQRAGQVLWVWVWVCV